MGFSLNESIDARRQAIIFLQDLARKVSSVASLIPRMMDSVVQGDEGKLEEHYMEVKQLDKEAELAKKDLISALIKTGPILSGRDELLRLVSTVASLMDALEAAAFRITYFKQLKNVPKEMLGKLTNLSKKVSEIVSLLRECIYLLGYNPRGISAVGRKLVKKEQEIDELHRGLEMEILESKVNVSSIITFLEIVRRMEEASDMAVVALDLIMILVMI